MNKCIQRELQWRKENNLVINSWKEVKSAVDEKCSKLPRSTLKETIIPISKYWSSLQNARARLKEHYYYKNYLLDGQNDFKGLYIFIDKEAPGYQAQQFLREQNVMMIEEDNHNIRYLLEFQLSLKLKTVFNYFETH